jgi:hypothetical protein
MGCADQGQSKCAKLIKCLYAGTGQVCWCKRSGLRSIELLAGMEAAPLVQRVPRGVMLRQHSTSIARRGTISF